MEYAQLLQGSRPLGEPDGVETATELDRARVVQCAPVRRLQQKTQVFPLDVKASVRSRLTHSLEVQQVARQLSLALLARAPHLAPWHQSWLNLLEMAALLHDVGNPPFGHFGEAVIRRWLAEHLPRLFERALGVPPSHLWQQRLLPDLLAFDGNAQSIRLVYQLQQLDVTWSLLATLIKVPYAVDEAPVPGRLPGFFISEAAMMGRLRQTLGLAPGVRMPLVYLLEVADDVCYCIADLQDAVDRGLLALTALQQAVGGLSLPWADALLQQAMDPEGEFFTLFRARLTATLVDGVTSAWLQHEAALLAGTFQGSLLAAIDGEIGRSALAVLDCLRQLARQQVFRSREVEALELAGYAAIQGVLHGYAGLLALPATAFAALFEGHGDPLMQRLARRLSRRHIAAWRQACAAVPVGVEAAEWEWYARVRLLIDYVSGMTDTYVQAEYRLLRGD